jgi:hypothetical protein
VYDPVRNNVPVAPAAPIFRTWPAGILENSSEDHVLAGSARGSSHGQALGRHVLENPISTHGFPAGKAAITGVRPGLHVPGREPFGRSFVRFPRPVREKLKPKI